MRAPPPSGLAEWKDAKWTDWHEMTHPFFFFSHWVLNFFFIVFSW